MSGSVGAARGEGGRTDPTRFVEIVISSFFGVGEATPQDDTRYIRYMRLIASLGDRRAGRTREGFGLIYIHGVLVNNSSNQPNK